MRRPGGIVEVGEEVGHRRRGSRARRVGDQHRQELLRALGVNATSTTPVAEVCGGRRDPPPLGEGVEAHGAGAGGERDVEVERVLEQVAVGGGPSPRCRATRGRSRRSLRRRGAPPPPRRSPPRRGSAPSPKSKPLVMPLSTNTRTAVRRLAVSGTELSTFWIDCTTSMRTTASASRSSRAARRPSRPARVARGHAVGAVHRRQTR